MWLAPSEACPAPSLSTRAPSQWRREGATFDESVERHARRTSPWTIGGAHLNVVNLIVLMRPSLSWPLCEVGDQLVKGAIPAFAVIVAIGRAT
jgi:hypothetical protein